MEGQPGKALGHQASSLPRNWKNFDWETETFPALFLDLHKCLGTSNQVRIPHRREGDGTTGLKPYDLSKF